MFFCHAARATHFFGFLKSKTGFFQPKKKIRSLIRFVGFFKGFFKKKILKKPKKLFF